MILYILIAIAAGLYGADFLLTAGERLAGAQPRRPWLRG